MKKMLALIPIIILIIVSFSGCVEERRIEAYVDIYDSLITGCQHETFISAFQWIDSSTPFQYMIPSHTGCSTLTPQEFLRDVNSCADYTGAEPNFQCTGVVIPPNYRCNPSPSSKYILRLFYDTSYLGDPGLMNLNVKDTNGNLIVNKQMTMQEPIVEWNADKIPGYITITVSNESAVWIQLDKYCCWDCKEKVLPAAIIYPNVDIESFSIKGGAEIVKDGKVINVLELQPGSTQMSVGVENRGFFTQTDVMVRFVDLPEGITANIQTGTQKIKAHQIGSYDVVFTVSPDTKEGLYSINAMAYSNKGTYDRLQMAIVIPSQK